ncbi:inverse autotransporter beta domain-containing protein [Jeongeupia naejangsanensis]|uniref:Inverse autotransporter beta domain-containing protein n=1 Tax=Jeongeupia naejangsanensis TaxID=613195 RepID=A0ABS2BKR9_9NEIS|nr:inverse autotransporter beta domain-containing protein [Jeongeupia naejangsanensis]MBM3116208.1 inverse autotransporter beta domain-containing protein [Jeongeupia naejangsanensis]
MRHTLILLLVAAHSWAADAPFPSDAAGNPLPDIGGGIAHQDSTQALATIAEQSLQGGEYGWRSTLLDHSGTGLESLLDRYGQARISTQLDDRGRIGDSNAEMLLPIDQQLQSSRFAQFGVNSSNDQLVGNLGIVQREQYGNWLTDYSAFVDQAIGDDTTRIGIGSSSSGSNLQFAVNAYLPVGQGDGSERAAPGFDLSAKAYLPDYPQLVGSVTFARYHGDGITLPDNDEARDNPSTFTAALNYQPMPLLRLGASVQRDDAEVSDWQIQAMLSYQLGVPLAKQLRSNAAPTSLARKRNEFVERNSAVALQRPTEQVPEATFSASLSAEPATSSATLNVQTSRPVVSLSWQGDASAYVVGGGPSPLLGRSGPLSARVKLALPSDGHSYSLAARVVDSSGNTTVTPAISLQAPMKNGA